MGLVVLASERQKERVKPKNTFDNVFKDAIEKTRCMGAIGERLSARIAALQKNWTRDEDPSDVLKLVLHEESKGTERNN